MASEGEGANARLAVERAPLHAYMGIELHKVDTESGERARSANWHLTGFGAKGEKNRANEGRKEGRLLFAVQSTLKAGPR